MQFQIMLRKRIFVDVVYTIIRIFQFNFICYFVNLEVVRCFIMRRRAITDMPILAWAYEYLLPNKDLSFVLVMPHHLSSIGMKMNRARDEILVSSMNRASSRLLCCEADDVMLSLFVNTTRSFCAQQRVIRKRFARITAGRVAPLSLLGAPDERQVRPLL